MRPFVEQIKDLFLGLLFIDIVLNGLNIEVLNVDDFPSDLIWELYQFHGNIFNFGLLDVADVNVKYLVEYLLEMILFGGFFHWLF